MGRFLRGCTFPSFSLSLIALRSLYSDCVFSTGFVGCVVMVYMCDANRLY